VKYVDEAGQTHYVQNENLIPEKYRGKAAPVTGLPSVQVGGGPVSLPSGPGYAPSAPGSSARTYGGTTQDWDRANAQKREAELEAQREQKYQKRLDRACNQATVNNASLGLVKQCLDR